MCPVPPSAGYPRQIGEPSIRSRIHDEQGITARWAPNHQVRSEAEPTAGQARRAAGNSAREIVASSTPWEGGSIVGRRRAHWRTVTLAGLHGGGHCRQPATTESAPSARPRRHPFELSWVGIRGGVASREWNAASAPRRPSRMSTIWRVGRKSRAVGDRVRPVGQVWTGHRGPKVRFGDFYHDHLRSRPSARWTSDDIHLVLLLDALDRGRGWVPVGARVEGLRGGTGESAPAAACRPRLARSGGGHGSSSHRFGKDSVQPARLRAPASLGQRPGDVRRGRQRLRPRSLHRFPHSVRDGFGVDNLPSGFPISELLVSWSLGQPLLNGAGRNVEVHRATSEHEQRLFEQMERALRRGPKFATLASGTAARVEVAKRMPLVLPAGLVGPRLLITGVAVKMEIVDRRFLSRCSPVRWSWRSPEVRLLFPEAQTGTRPPPGKRVEAKAKPEGRLHGSP